MPPLVVYGVLLAAVLALAWPGSAGGAAVISVTDGLAGVFRSGAGMIGGLT